MTQSLSPTLAVGVIVRPHGIRGEVKIQPLTDRAEDWLDLRAVEWTDRQGARICRRVKHQRLQGDVYKRQSLMVRELPMHSMMTSAPSAPKAWRMPSFREISLGFMAEMPQRAAASRR